LKPAKCTARELKKKKKMEKEKRGGFARTRRLGVKYITYHDKHSIQNG